MNSISPMEWNSKPPLQWDWENLVMFNATTSENPKQLEATNLKTDGQRGTDSGSFHWGGSGSSTSSVGVSGSGAGGSCSDLGFPSLSKSSKSPSINSSSTGEVKTSKFTLEASEAIPLDFSYKKDLAKSKPAGTSPTIEASVGSGEPLLDLKLGKRTYFEDICGGSNTKSPSSPMIPMSSVTPAKRSKSSNQGMQVARCQVEGCNLDLSSAKVYHRKHRVCESHTKCPMVIVAGLERRFCQQCSRFHGLSEFDEKKRSCRRRLSDHNARRRKAKPGSLHLHPARLSSSLYDERQPMSFVWDSSPLVCTRPSASATWEGTSGSKFTITKEYIPKPEKLGGFDGRSLHLPRSCPTNAIGVQNHHSFNGLLPFKDKDTPAEVLRQGLKGSIISSNVDATPDLHRALSLLSTNSWGSCEPQSVSVEHPMRASFSSMPQSVLHVSPQNLPLASSEYWRTEQHPADSRVHTLTSHNDGRSYFQKFQLLRTANEDGFYSGQIN